ncbi:MAG: aspartate carbamoyltransferase [Chloroflexota bacterium]
MTITRMNRNPLTSRRIMGVIALTIILMVVGIFAWQSLAHQARQADVAVRGSEVMPFDLDQTMHHFVPQPDGGLQTVVVRDSTDSEQIALIREHLHEEAGRFAQGNFASPEAIHGHTMPGLADLEAGAERITVDYAELPDGAQIRYTTADPALIDAIHDWFAAQVSDHGHHATDH